MLRWLLLLFWILAFSGGSEAHARPEGELWSSGLSRIDALYLWRSEIDPADMVASAADELEQELEWFVSSREGHEVHIHHGDGRFLGKVSVDRWEDILPALFAFSEMVEQSGEILDPEIDLEVVLLRGAVDALDNHSRVLHGERLRSFDKRLRGTLSGIGTRIRMVDHVLTVIEIYANTPAERSGVEVDDRIERIDGVSTVGMEIQDAVDRITGERGTEVVLGVSRTVDGEQVELDLSLIRARIKLPNVRWNQDAPGYSYIKIDHFSEQTVANLRRGLQELSREGGLERGLILDLRDNTGGSMIQAARAADLFVTEGDLVSTVGPQNEAVSGLIPRISALDEGREIEIPIVVLQNARTASGSEIVAGALRELDRAILLGQASYGKGTVQKVYTLREDVRLKLTVARFLLSGGMAIEEEGIPADILVGQFLLGEHGMVTTNMGQVANQERLRFVQQGEGWIEGEEKLREDPLRAFALRILEAADEPDRASLLEVAEQVRRRVQIEEDERAVAAMAARVISWQGQSEEGPVEPRVDVVVVPLGEAESGGHAEFRLEVFNRGVDLHRVAIRMEEATGLWSRQIVPLGFLAQGESATGVARLSIPAWTTSKELELVPIVTCQGCEAQEMEAHVLAIHGEGKPPISLDLGLVPDGENWRVRVGIANEGMDALREVSVRFLFPESTGVELIHYDAGLERLEAGESALVHLGLFIPSDRQVIPLEIRVADEEFGRLASWELELEKSGLVVHLDAPRIRPVDLPSSHLAGPISLAFALEDDSAIDHVVIWSGTEKLAYFPGEGPQLTVELETEIDVGINRFLVHGTDDQGLRRVVSWTVRGIPDPELTTDADEGPQP